jgi:hypothetical protein
MLLFSIAAGFLWSILMLYGIDGPPELPRRVADYEDSTSVISHSFYFEVNPIAYVLAGAVAAVGILLVVAASRLRSR